MLQPFHAAGGPELVAELGLHKQAGEGVEEEQQPEQEVGGLVYVCSVEVASEGEEDLCPVEEATEPRRVVIGVDSGAAASVWPRDLCAYYPTKRTDKTGVKYATAGKGSQHLINEGERVLHLKMGDGSRRGAKMQVTNVRKPLMSVADMNDAGQDVYFLASGQSYAVHRETGMVTKFTRKKNIFEIDAEVPPYGESSGL